jgi:hypothetical protein
MTQAEVRVLGRTVFFLFALAVSVPVSGGTKESGTTMLKDLQPAGTTDKKKKNQQYDLFFASSSSGKEYTCRTSHGKSIRATDFVVGSPITYKLKDNNAKIKNTGGAELSCTIVRVENTPTATNK